jgi:hypothetical protein
MNVRLVRGPFGTYFLIAADGQDLFFTVDVDLPRLASTFGWTPCPCGETDGTIDCEHKSTTEMIASAREFLDEHIGDEADDLGYFA